VFITTSENNPIPLYQQIVDQIRSQIMIGELRAGDSLPSIRQLAKDLTTSVITTKRGLPGTGEGGVHLHPAG
jgi:GntR family transcriptional regulator